MKEYLSEQFRLALKSLNYTLETPVQFEKPKFEAHGDLSTNVAMLLAKSTGKNPRAIAGELVAHLKLDPAKVAAVEIAGPGFINIRLTNNIVVTGLRGILEQKETYGRTGAGEGKKALVEFVSANPTGPLSVGHGRQAALGDTIANLLAHTGYDVTREYYYNNAGRQMRVLAESTYARYRQLAEPGYPFPEDGYQGEYIIEIADALYKATDGSLLKLQQEEAINKCKEYAEGVLFGWIKDVLAKMGVVFDSYFNEDTLYASGLIKEVIEEFRKRDLAYDAEGAIWFRTSSLGLEQDRVIVKSTGEPTYRLPDIAYHREKFRRGFDLMVDIFGADHIATIPDVLAGVKALGYDPEKVKVVIHQFVTLMRDGEQVKMSKRLANFVTLDELIDEVGSDAVRFFFLMRSPSSHLEFDLNLAKEQSEKNPVYYLQYAHARIASILRFGVSEGIITSEASPEAIGADLGLLNHPSEIALIKLLLDFPTVVEASAITFEPHRLTSYLHDVATGLHKFYQDVKVVIPEKPLALARLGLCLGTKTVLANGLKLLGVSAPEKM
jgi:arginyl-tRNA synthetase